MSTSRFSLRDKATLRLVNINCYGADVVEWPRELDIRQSDLFPQCINGVRSNPVEVRTQM